MRRFVLAMALAAISAAAPPVQSWAADAPASDQQIAQSIADALSGSGRLEGYSIAVKYKRGTARLEGYVRNPEQMTSALDIVSQLPEVSDVVNELSIRHDPAVTRAAAGRAEVPVADRGAAIDASFQPVEEERSIYERYDYEPVVEAQPVAYPQPRGRQPTPRSRPVYQQQAQIYQQQAQNGGELLPPPSGAPVPSSYEYQYQTAAAPLPVETISAQPIPGGGFQGAPLPAYVPGAGGGIAPAVYDQPTLPNYAWPSYAAYPNYAAVSYPRQYSPSAWPYIGPFYPYPQVPLGWRKVTLEWDDGWWYLDFSDDRLHCCGH